MEKYISPYTITDNMLNKVSDIMQELSKIKVFSGEEVEIKSINNELDLMDLYISISGTSIKEYRKIDFKNHPSYTKVIGLIDNLFNWYSFAKNKTHPLILAGVIYSSFIFISPFINNNVLIANMWLKSILVNFNKSFKNINIEKYFDEHHNEYEILLNNVNTNGFIEFLLEAIYSSLLKTKFNYEKNSNINKLLNIMELNKPMTAYEIMEKLNIKSKETLRNSYLNFAIKENLINLTIPDKPTSRNQQYYRVI